MNTPNILRSVWNARHEWGYFPLMILINIIDGVFGSTSAFKEFFSSRYLITVFFIIQLIITALVALSWLKNRYTLIKKMVFISLIIETVLMISMTILLLMTLSLPYSPDTAVRLLLESITIWFINVLIFSLWYWFIDGGGVTDRKYSSIDEKNRWERLISNEHSAGMDFWFPQQSQCIPGYKMWSPNCIDYLFLAFSTSTALSPTDTLVLSRKAKVLMTIQALNSLIALTVVAARAINSL